MFFIEVPYKSTVHCVENTTRSANDYELNSMLHTNGKMQDCVWTEPKEPSIVFDAIINLSIICGSIFIVLSAYAYYRKSKQNKTPPTQPQ